MLAGVDSRTWRRPSVQVTIRDAAPRIVQTLYLTKAVDQMSISTPHGGGGSRKPADAKPAAGAKPKSDADEIEELEEDTSADPVPAHPRARKSSSTSSPSAFSKTSSRPKPTGSRPAGARPAAKAGGPRRPIKEVKATGGRNWGPTALFAAVIALAVGIIGYGGWQVYQNGLTYQQRAARIDGIQDYTQREAELLKGSQHQWGSIDYKYKPPFGGKHNENWQRCLGDVYTAPIASEHAVHSLEHGAVWITYRPDLPADQVEMLGKKVRGNDHMLMSPFPGLDKPISLQAWGYQLKVDKADDPRIDEFVRALKTQAGPEKATCSSGNMITETGDKPFDIGKPAPSPSAAAGG
jgi:hypothetical protein